MRAMPAAPLPATRFVLIEPSHAGNVGATARAMKVMGFNDLVLVAPRWPDVLARPEAIERASGADDVLARARIVPTLDEALAGVTHLCATVMTPRDFGPPTRSPREHFEMLLKQELPAPATQGLEAENASNSGAPEAGQGVAPAAYAVGYESPTQFSREYSRAFGVAPSRDRPDGAEIAAE